MDVILLLSGNMTYWKCKACGNIQEGKELPEECDICFAGPGSFEKVDETDVDLVEATDKKKKYRRVFKKGFERRLTRKR
jgi:rubredoxin